MSEIEKEMEQTQESFKKIDRPWSQQLDIRGNIFQLKLFQW